MKTIQIIIERSKDAYWAHAKNIEGVNGVGDTVAGVKASVLEGIEIQKELGNIPNVKYAIKYKFDTQSLLNYYKGVFTNASLERITGINQKRLQHYSTGVRKPSEAQANKIQTGLHSLANDLLALEL